MKIDSLIISDFHPLKYLQMEDLGDLVIIAGSNGAGKTRLKQAIVQTLQGSPVMDITIKATRREEREEKYFNGDELVVKKGIENGILKNYINSRKYLSSGYVGSLVQIDSNRNIETLKLATVNWLGGDPDDLEGPTNYYFSPFTNRWLDFMNYIHQKSAARDKKLADELKKNPKNGEKIIKNNPDPLGKYKKAFSELLPGKELLEINPASPNQFRYKDQSGMSLAFQNLSSGEQEVVKVIFDVLRKDIKHSIIIVDEPELHLHPTLTFKLVETLKAIGDHTNQFIFLTHSADLISTYYSTESVFFLDGNQSGSNQAHKLSNLNHSHRDLVQIMGQNLGLFAVGKKLIFVEGENSSIDRVTYHAIVQQYLPDAKVIPIGSVHNMATLNAVEEQIRSSIFGINFFMIRDRDGLNEDQVTKIEENGRIKCLGRRHIENYFLDAEILLKVAERFYIKDENKLNKKLIEKEIKEIAKSTIGFNLLQNAKDFLSFNYSFKIPTVKNVDAKDNNAIKNEIIAGVEESLISLSTGLAESILRTWLDNEETKIKTLVASSEWKVNFQGKIIFEKLCGKLLKISPIKVRQAYVDIALKEKPAIFQDIIDILKSFESLVTPVSS